MKKSNVLLITVVICAFAASVVLSLHPIWPTAIQDPVQKVALSAGIIGLLFFALNLRSERAVGGGKRFSKLDVESTASETTFSDVAANDEARRSLMGLVDYIRNPEKYASLGARMPRGVLLYGPPGTGKTLLAKALSGEAGVPFFALNGSDFVQMYVGVGASRVRDLFSKAKKAGKCVIFIDEIDAMGKRRDEGGSDEREQTLNALLSEMSGFHPNDGVVVVAATNRIDTLDPALLRPGRFDRQIEEGLPGKPERLSILKLHSRNKPLEPSIDLDALACSTTSFSGASLESLLNEAAIFAAERGAEVIGRQDIDRAYLTTVAGEDRAMRANREEKAIIAIHEAGHALVTRLLLKDQMLQRVSILPTGKGAAGYSLSVPPETTVLNRARLIAQVRVLLAGRAAEMLIGGEEDLTSGASGDLKRAAELISTMVMDLGMECGPGVSLRGIAKACSSGAPNAFKLCRDALNREFEAVTQILSENAGALTALAEALIDREALTGEEVERILNLEACA